MFQQDIGECFRLGTAHFTRGKEQAFHCHNDNREILQAGFNRMGCRVNQVDEFSAFPQSAPPPGHG